jgi:serine/threonine protein kinase
MATDIQNNIKNRKSFLCKIMIKAVYFRIIGKNNKMMTVLAEGFLSLGGVYVKFLQGVLLQIPMMKLWKNKRRFDVYENVPIDSIDIHRFLQDNLRVSQMHQIISVSDEPFASGSFGQVYEGLLRSQEKVAIKVLRPNTRKILKSDLRLIRVISKFIAGLMTNWDIDLKVLVRDFVKSTLAETNYTAEVDFAEKLYEYYDGNKTIVIPKTHKELCSKTVIVQDYIDGFSLAQLLRRKNSHNDNYLEMVYNETGSDLRIQLQQLGVELNKAVLRSAPIHGDPHPGNIRLLPNNKVALLDFGIQTKSIEHPNAYYSVLKEFWRAEYLNEPRPGEMFVAYIRFYAGKLYESIKLVSDYESNKSNKIIKLDEWIAQFSNKLFKDKVSPDMLMEGLDKIRDGGDARDISVDKIVNPGNRFSIGVKTENGLVLRAMANYLSLVMELGYRSIIPSVYNEIVTYVEKELPELSLDIPSTMSITEAMETVYVWLEKIARKDMDLYRQIVSYISPATT